MLVGLLAEARRRRIPFEIAWPESVAIAISGAGDEAGDWIQALEDTRGAWEASFARATTSRREAVLSLLGDPTDRVPLGDGCPQCGEPLPPAKRGPRVYCRDSCRKRASALGLAA